MEHGTVEATPSCQGMGNRCFFHAYALGAGIVLFAALKGEEMSLVAHSLSSGNSFVSLEKSKVTSAKVRLLVPGGITFRLILCLALLLSAGQARGQISGQ